MKKNTIAVIIPSYNYGQFLSEAIESVLSQTILPDEILISDDCSTDNTFAIAYQYQQKYPHLIRVNRNENNLGIVKHFNKAVSLINTAYVCFLGADNVFPPNYLEETSRVLDEGSKVAIAYTNFELFGERAELVHSTFREEWKIKGINGQFVIDFPDFSEQTEELLYEGVNFIHGSSMFKKKVFDEIGGYLDKKLVPEDYNLFLRMVDADWKAEKAKSTFLFYRQHSEEQQNIKIGKIALLEQELSIVQQNLSNYEKMYHDLLNSWSFKFGDFVFSPFKRVKRLLKRN